MIKGIVITAVLSLAMVFNSVISVKTTSSEESDRTYFMQNVPSATAWRSKNREKGVVTTTAFTIPQVATVVTPTPIPDVTALVDDPKIVAITNTVFNDYSQSLPTAATAGGWGQIKVKSGGTVKEVDAFQAICCIVNTEMGAGFSTEALKAQAVAAYSYFKYNNSKGTYPSVNFSQTVPEKVVAAVRAVEGQSAWYRGSIAQTVYCASSAGFTASAEDVWGTNVPYLVSVESIYDKTDPNYGIKKSFESQEFARLVFNETGIHLTGNTSDWISVQSVEAGGYNGVISLGGQTSYTKNGKSMEINGRTLREQILDFDIRSSYFTVSSDSNNITFTTYGYGHGVGMPQHGANFYAKNEGWNYIQILQHYYPGINIS